MPDLRRRLPFRFKESAYYPTDWIPGAIAVADLDGDGHQDLLFGLLAFAPGDGRGNFRAAKPIAAIEPEHIAVGDLNDDGIPDVVVTSGVHAISVILGRGGGQFAAVSYVPLEGTAGSMDLADFDQDGHLDVAVATALNTTNEFLIERLLILRGRGDGSFGSVAAALSLSPLGDIGLAHGDLDGDGRPDLVYTAGGLSAFVYVVLNSTLLTKPIVASYAATPNLGDILVTDINADGRGDVIAAEGFVGIMIAAAAGTLAPAKSYPTGAGAWRGLTAADFDGDGFLDIAAGDFHNGVHILHGNGDGTLHAPVAFSVDTNSNIARMVTADFNEDGMPDLVVSTEHDVMVYLNDRK